MRFTVRAILALALYFGVLLIPNLIPAVQSTGWYFAYLLSLPFVLLCLIGVALWAGIAWLLTRDDSRARAHRQRLIVSVAGVMLFLTAFGLARTIQGALPTGSRLLVFDRSTWLDPASSQFVDGDITQRQKMLADVVTNVLPDRRCDEIENLIGPSLETQYFQSTERDLIYVLGPERDSFMSIDSEWLLVWCAPSGQFERYAIVRD
jgi:hypothetical protein